MRIYNDAERCIRRALLKLHSKEEKVKAIKVYIHAKLFDAEDVTIAGCRLKSRNGEAHTGPIDLSRLANNVVKGDPYAF